MITWDTLNALPRVTFRRGELELQLLPSLGGKLITLRRQDGPNVLLEPPEYPYREPPPHARFEDYDTSGFDDCFPTVAPCADPDQEGQRLPDHGELWSRPHAFALLPHGDGFALSADLRWGGHLRRTFHVERATLTISYELTRAAGGGAARRYLWSAHPLLRTSPGSRIVLPAEVRSLVLESSVNQRLGRKGDRVGWPRHGAEDLSVVSEWSARTADKLFTDALHEGWARLHDAARGYTVGFRFDAARTPYLGLWLCQGGWPRDREPGHYTVAIEPCSGRPDSLFEAAERGECAGLWPGERALWTLQIELPPAEADEASPAGV